MTTTPLVPNLPSDAAFVGDQVFVATSNLRPGSFTENLPGTVLRVGLAGDHRSFVGGTLTSTFTLHANPVAMAAYTTQGGKEVLLVLCGGAASQSAGAAARPSASPARST